MLYVTSKSGRSGGMIDTNGMGVRNKPHTTENAMSDISRAVLVPYDNRHHHIVGLISRPTRELHSAANLMNVLDDFLRTAPDNIDLPDGRYTLLHVCKSPRTGQIIFRNRTSSFMITTTKD